MRLQQGLRDPRDVAVAEDAPAAGDQPAPYAVALAVLVRQKPYGGLRDGVPNGCHCYTATGKCMCPACSSGTSSSGHRAVTTLPRV
jgi:hypothetical protein